MGPIPLRESAHEWMRLPQRSSMPYRRQHDCRAGCTQPNAKADIGKQMSFPVCWKAKDNLASYSVAEEEYLRSGSRHICNEALPVISLLYRNVGTVLTSCLWQLPYGVFVNLQCPEPASSASCLRINHWYSDNISNIGLLNKVVIMKLTFSYHSF